MQRRFSFAFVVVTAIIALTFGTLAGGVAGGLTALILDPSSQPVEDVAEVNDTPASTTNLSPTPPPANAESETRAEPGDPVRAEPRESTIADVVEEVSPAVVTVVNRQRVPNLFEFDDETDDPEDAGVGSGFIIDGDGHIVTNHHVIDGSEEITVLLYDGTETDATLVGADQFADIAVIKIEDDVPGVVTLGDSDSLRPGEHVIAIGSALGDYTNTVTDGIVSAKGRNLQTQGGFNLENMLQHSASINPGNSGGPLLNLNGEVVGVNTAVVRGSGYGITIEGLGFAIPSNTVAMLVSDLIEEGGLNRPYMGIVYEPLPAREARANELPVESGVVVREVEDATPASDAGLQAEDIITKINGVQITEENPLINQLFAFDIGETIELEVYRPGEDTTHTLQLTLAERPDLN